jgi:iron complex outermembrane receptor protein
MISLIGYQAQNCNITIQGQVLDEATDLPLSFVNIFIQETYDGAVTDDNGRFVFNNICPGEYHFTISHIGCESKKIHLDVVKDTFFNIGMLHSATSMDAVVIKGKTDKFSNLPKSTISRQKIEDNSNQNLSGLLENESGVHLIKNGSGISKPVVHGLYGNRLTVINNGIVQSGQQWGNDHSPEIDPFTADNITILKAASALEFGGGNLGSVILLTPNRIGREPHLHGQINYAFETNGLGHNVNARLQKYSPFFAWRLNGTFKKYGDRKTSNYFLNNTGNEEFNLSAQIEKSINDKFFFDFYASSFNTSLGVLRGSHIGNLTDLEQALTNEVPFFTEADFSYGIEAPRQQVSHHLVKFKTKYFAEENKILELVIAGQINDRKEFDVRRSGREDTPSLSLAQYTFNSELKYTTTLNKSWKLKIGNQNIITDNSNDPETGILPLIPDYFSWKSSLFSTLSNVKDRVQYNLGIRYDFEHQDVVTISNSVPREIIRYENQFQNVSTLLSAKFNIAKSQSIGFNTAFAMRNPAINELYSNGLHQGVSGIEEGDINLKTEKVIKNTLEYQWIPNTNFNLNALVYHQHFKDYIFLNPQEEIRLTIRGAFPVFKYSQTDANIYGLDISTRFTLGHTLVGSVKYSYIKGMDVKDDIPLVFMPPNSLYGSLIYQMKKNLKISNKLMLEEIKFELNNRLVFEQKNILPEQDFIAPPKAYNLIGAKASTNVILSNYKIRFFLKVDNLLNVQYRDYLNRQRYFADDLGVSITTGISFKF